MTIYSFGSLLAPGEALSPPSSLLVLLLLLLVLVTPKVNGGEVELAGEELAEPGLTPNLNAGALELLSLVVFSLTPNLNDDDVGEAPELLLVVAEGTPKLNDDVGGEAPELLLVVADDTPKLKDGAAAAAAAAAPAAEGPPTVPNSPFVATGARLKASETGTPAFLMSSMAASASSRRAPTELQRVERGIAQEGERTVVEVLDRRLADSEQRHPRAELRRRLGRRGGH